MLAARAPVAAAPAEFFAFDGGVAAAAGVATTPIDPRHTAVVAVVAGEVAEVAEGCAAGADAGFKHLHQGLSKALQL